MNEKETLQLIARNIKRHRIQKDMTQAQLAHTCQIQKAAVSRIEAGKVNVTVKTLTKICNALQLEVAALLNQQM